MDIAKEFDALDLSRAQESLAWDARAKITWGDAPADVQAALVAGGIDEHTANRIVGLVLRERSLTVRAKGMRDLTLGLLIGAVAAGVSITSVAVVKFRLVAVPIRGIAIITAISSLVMVYAGLLVWRGLARLVTGARSRGAVSDVDEWM